MIPADIKKKKILRIGAGAGARAGVQRDQLSISSCNGLTVGCKIPENS